MLSRITSERAPTAVGRGGPALLLFVVHLCIPASACRHEGSYPRTPTSARTKAADEPLTAADAIARAVESPLRPAEDRVRDAGRRPAAMLAFFGIRPGMSVAELMSGRGYYAELLGRVVGPTGTVYAQNNAFVLHKFAEGPLTARLRRPGLERVQRLDRELDNLALPEGELDAVLIILFYHDTFWMHVDRAKMNGAVYRALKPGGVYGVIDHDARAGDGASVVKSLHRIESSLVKKEILAAGFVLDGESAALRSARDDHSLNVFDPRIHGRTDRFAYRFRKPAL